MTLLQTINAIVVHHSATSRDVTFEALRRYHTAPPPIGRGWTDIGYHAVILGNGDIRQGRPIPLAGAHAPPLNHSTIGLCIVGDNTKPGREWNREQIESAKLYINAASLLFPGIPVLAHRDVQANHTECPGISRARLLELLDRPA